MVMWRCLIVAVGAALARSDAQEEMDALIDAASKGDHSFLRDVEAVRGLLDAGLDANKRHGDYGDTLLHFVAASGDPKVVQLLVEYGADVDLQTSEGATPLLVASSVNRPEIVKALLDSGANPNIAREDGLTPLHWAAKRGNVMIIDDLVERGAAQPKIDADLSDATNYGASPLHIAVFGEYKDAIAALTKHGASWDLKNAQGYTPADMGAVNGMSRDQFEHLTRSDARRNDLLQEKMDAVASALDNGDFSILNDVKVMRGLLDAGWDVSSREEGQRLLHLTAKHGDPKVIQLLVESYGADVVDLQDSQGSTPLLLASIENRTENVKVLLDSSADPTIARKDGVTPLHMAANLGNVEIIDMLAKQGAKINAQLSEDATNHGASPLHYAVLNKHKDAIAALTKHGANWDLRLKDAAGVSPAELGASYGISRDQFEHLVEAPADDDRRALDDEGALRLASQNGDTKVMRYLLGKGTDANARAEKGVTPLLYATRGQKPKAVAVLLEFGADPDLAELTLNMTPLMTAVSLINYDIVKLLLASGRVDPNIAGKDGTTPLHLVAGLKSAQNAALEATKIVHLLVEHGAEVNAQIPDGRYAGITPLYMAVEMEFEGVIAVLTRHGANWDLEDAKGVSPADMGARNGMPRDEFAHLYSHRRRTGKDKIDWVGSALAKRDYSFLNDVEFVRGTLDGSWDVNKRSRDGVTILHMTARYGDPEVVQLLIGYGATVDFQDLQGATPLLLASYDNRTEIVQVLLNSGADPNIAREDSLTPLLMAARWGNVMAIDLLVAHGAEVDAQISEIDTHAPGGLQGHSPLHVAIAMEQKDAVAALTKHGASWDLKNAKGETAAEMSAEHGMSRDQFEHLVEARADDPAPDDAEQDAGEEDEWEEINDYGYQDPRFFQGGGSPLHDACVRGDLDAVRESLASGFHVNSRSYAGKTCLHLAAYHAHAHLVAPLVAEGADIEAVSAGSTALLLAAFNGPQQNAFMKAIVNGVWSSYDRWVDVSKNLLAAGADPDAADLAEWTALHHACNYAMLDLIPVLLAGGANVNARAKAGRSALHLTLEAMSPEQRKVKTLHAPIKNLRVVVQLLIDSGADLSVVDETQLTPLHVAVENGLDDMVRLLLRAGASTMPELPPDERPRWYAARLGHDHIVKMLDAADAGFAGWLFSEVVPVLVRLVAAALAVAATVAYLRASRRKKAAERWANDLLRGEAAPAPKPKAQRAAKKPAKRREAPRARRRQAPRARESALEAKTPEPAVAASEPKPEPAPTRPEPPRPAPVAAPPLPRADTEPPKPVPECKTEEPESKREEPEAPVVPRGYETVAHILEAHGESAKLATFEEQLINDETLPFLEASDLLQLGVSPMAILAIVEVSSAARGKAKKLDAEDALDGAAKHQSVLEETLREHRAEIERLRIGRGEIPDHLLCGITLEIMKDPVIAADGHTYEKCAIEQWLATGARTSPTTNEPLASLQLLPNHLAKKAIADEMDARRGSR